MNDHLTTDQIRQRAIAVAQEAGLPCYDGSVHDSLSGQIVAGIRGSQVHAVACVDQMTEKQIAIVACVSGEEDDCAIVWGQIHPEARQIWAPVSPESLGVRDVDGWVRDRVAALLSSHDLFTLLVAAGYAAYRPPVRGIDFSDVHDIPKYVEEVMHIRDFRVRHALRYVDLAEARFAARVELDAFYDRIEAIREAYQAGIPEADALLFAAIKRRADFEALEKAMSLLGDKDFVQGLRALDDYAKDLEDMFPPGSILPRAAEVAHLSSPETWWGEIYASSNDAWMQKKNPHLREMWEKS